MITQVKNKKPPKDITRAASMNDMVADLRKRGYKFTFRREATCLYCLELNRWITTDNFTVEECYHFEDVSNPDQDRMLYAISLTRRIKGFLIEASFVYQDNISPEMMQKLAYSKNFLAVA